MIPGLNITVLVAVFVSVCIAAYFLMRDKKIPTIVKDLDPALIGLLSTHVRFYEELAPENKVLFEQRVAYFLDHVRIEGVETTVEDLDRVLVASGAIIPIFNLGNWHYNNLGTVLLYPDTFNKSFEFEEGADRNILGMVGTGYMNGQMILSKSALREGFENNTDKNNTAIHEFVHLLDKSDGAIDGIPENLIAHSYSMPWIKMMHEEIEKIKEGESDINPYAATNDSEFLAVVSEYFFERPDLLEAKHPELYGMLSKMFRKGETP